MEHTSPWLFWKIFVRT